MHPPSRVRNRTLIGMSGRFAGALAIQLSDNPRPRIAIQSSTSQRGSHAQNAVDHL